MIVSTFNTLIYTPLYNGLIFLLEILPWHNLALAVVLLTVIIKTLLFPLTKKSIQTQIKMRELEPKIKELQEKYKDNREKLAVETMAFYRNNNFNPFAGFLLIFIQLPIIFGLYFVFSRGGFPDIDHSLLYSFITAPVSVDTLLFRVIDITGKSVLLAGLTGITQFIQFRLTLPKMKKRSQDAGFKDDIMHSMQIQMRYVMPVVITFIAYHVSAAVALYWVTSNIFTIGQEFFLRRHREEVTQE